MNINELLKLYDITKEGKMIRKRDGKEIKGCIDSAGYVKVSPRIEGIQYQLKMHRLVAKIYIPNTENKPQINHINGNKTDNRIENLEWVTAKENIHHAFKNNLSSNNHLKKRVYQIDPTSKQVLQVYNSYREASLNTGITETNISAVCREYKPSNRPAPRKTAGGFVWKTCND